LERNKQEDAGVNNSRPAYYMRMPWPEPSAKGGDPVRAAFEAEALASIDSLYRTALRLTRMPADAEDLVQETMLKAFRAEETFKPGTNLRAWLFTILHNTARNRVRDRVRDHVDVDSETVERAGDQVMQGTVETPETLLPGAFREAVWLRDVEEFSYAEIAEMLGVPVGTVMSRISRGRRMLFDKLQHLRPAHV
jgi:RNA polymerase sigma-70 factor (ECF subfamily)